MKANDDFARPGMVSGMLSSTASIIIGIIIIIIMA